MTNDENRMTKETRNPKPEKGVGCLQIRISSFFRISSFDIRNL